MVSVNNLCDDIVNINITMLELITSNMLTEYDFGFQGLFCRGVVNENVELESALAS